MQPSPRKLNVTGRFLIFNILAALVLLVVISFLEFVVFASASWAPFLVWAILPVMFAGNWLALRRR